MKNVTIEQLAELVGGKVWVKGDYQRVYVNAGYTTKKMKTTSYYYLEGGEVKVSVFVECPAQPVQWCQNEAARVRESMEGKLERVLAEVAESTATTNVEQAPEPDALTPEELSGIEKQLTFSPLPVEKNPHYNPRLTPVTHVANLSETPFIDYYHGAVPNRCVAYIHEGKLLAFHYGKRKSEMAMKLMPEGAEAITCQPSCTQLCFIAGKI